MQVRVPVRVTAGVYACCRVATLVAVIVVAGCSPASEANRTGAPGWQAAEGKASVAMTIDYGDGMEKRFGSIPYQNGMTVLAALEAAASHWRGIQFEKTGSGEAAMLTRIDDVSNQATGGESRNWIYRVNGKLATVSCDAYSLNPGDVILWRFEQYENGPEVAK